MFGTGFRQGLRHFVCATFDSAGLQGGEQLQDCQFFFFSLSRFHSAHRAASAIGCRVGWSVPLAHQRTKRVMRCESESRAIVWPTRLFGLTGRSNTPTSAPADRASNAIEALSGVTLTVPLRAICAGSQSGVGAVCGTSVWVAAGGNSSCISGGLRREV